MTSRESGFEWTARSASRLRRHDEITGCPATTPAARREEHFEDKACIVRIEWSFCNYGGHRPWFRCPIAGCERRVAILYFGSELACRQCCGLAYRTQRVPAHYRAIYRAQAMRQKLGGSLNLPLPLPVRPKGMHWETYFRLCREAEGWESRSWPRWLRKRATSIGCPLRSSREP